MELERDNICLRPSVRVAAAGVEYPGVAVLEYSGAVVAEVGWGGVVVEEESGVLEEACEAGVEYPGVDEMEDGIVILAAS